MTPDGSAPEPAALRKLQDALAHRGPDGQAMLVRDGVGLVHLRLAIVDLATGAQPLLAPAGTALIACGEIYNDPDLRRTMAGSAFRTHSDCEPATFLAEQEGMTFSGHLRGMYAIAAHDPRTAQLLLTRDPFGIKPLYYAQSATGFAFASEPQALLAAGFGSRTIGRRQMAELLQLKFVTGTETIFSGISRTLPGETLRIKHGAIVERSRRAALPMGGPVSIRPETALRQLEGVLLDSVAAHLRSDVPYGLFLSGGIDSSALLALMRRVAATRIQTMTIGWEGYAEADESHEAERLARAAGADCERLVMTAQDFWSLAPQMAAAVDDPTTDAAVLPTWMLGRAARAAGLKVTLCGEGADELFGGYSRYRKRRLPWRWLSRPPRTKGALGTLPTLDGWREGLAEAERGSAALPTQAGERAGSRSPLQQTQAVDCAEWLPNDLLVKLDRCLMAHGVEGRTPFLDPVVADFVFRLPDAQKAGLQFGKRLLRAWLARAFPEAQAWTPKKGFNPPVGAWIQHRAEQVGKLVSTHPALTGLLPAETVRGAFANAAAAPQPAWSLLFTALWHSHHVLGLPADGNVLEVLEAASRA
jgi:asparagine synthase (glutamine-hydrolysing)